MGLYRGSERVKINTLIVFMIVTFSLPAVVLVIRAIVEIAELVIVIVILVVARV